MDQTETVRLLKEVYQNSRTAVDAIGTLLPKTSSEDFASSLRRQMEEYRKIADDAAMQLRGFRELPEESGVFSKLGMWTGVQMSTLVNKSTDHMAEIMINGSTMGVIEMTKYLNANPDVSSFALDLARRLVAAEQDNIDVMRRYL